MLVVHSSVSNPKQIVYLFTCVQTQLSKAVIELQQILDRKSKQIGYIEQTQPQILGNEANNFVKQY